MKKLFCLLAALALLAQPLRAAEEPKNFRIRFHTSPQPVTRSACTAATMIICRRWTMERRCAI